MFSVGLVGAGPDHAVAPAGEAPTEVGSVWICSRFALLTFAQAFLLAIMLAEGTPVRTNDFSQSCDEGPRILPSRKARPGHRVQFETWVQDVHVVRSFRRIERTSFILSE